MASKTRPGEKILKAHAFLVYCFLYLPILILIVFSFNQSQRSTVWQGFTLHWYFSLLNNAELLQSLKNSLIVGFAATLTSTITGTLAALALVRYNFRGRSFFDGLVFLPMLVPEIVMGVALLTLFVGFGIRLSLWTVILSHVAFCSSYVAITVRARLQGFTRSLEEAAMDLGADEWATFKKVSLPLMSPGILAGAMLAFTLSFDDFVVTFFNAGVGATTLPLKIYSMLKFGVTPEINAISTIMLILTFMLMVLYDRVQGREKGL
jgi:spermidine/putrescine transport system permease protein